MGENRSPGYAQAKAPPAKTIEVKPQAQGPIHRIETYSGVRLETDEGEVSLRKSTIERSLVHSKSAQSQKRTTVTK